MFEVLKLDVSSPCMAQEEFGSAVKHSLHNSTRRLVFTSQAVVSSPSNEEYPNRLTGEARLPSPILAFVFGIYLFLSRV